MAPNDGRCRQVLLKHLLVVPQSFELAPVVYHFNVGAAQRRAVSSPPAAIVERIEVEALALNEAGPVRSQLLSILENLFEIR